MRWTSLWLVPGLLCFALTADAHAPAATAGIVVRQIVEHTSGATEGIAPNARTTDTAVRGNHEVLGNGQGRRLGSLLRLPQSSLARLLASPMATPSS